MNIKDQIGILAAHGAEFVVVGGQAGVLRQAIEFSQHLDIIIRPTRENAERIRAAVREIAHADPDVDLLLGREFQQYVDETTGTEIDVHLKLIALPSFDARRAIRATWISWVRRSGSWNCRPCTHRSGRTAPGTPCTAARSRTGSDTSFSEALSMQTRSFWRCAWTKGWLVTRQLRRELLDCRASRPNPCSKPAWQPSASRHKGSH